MDTIYTQMADDMEVSNLPGEDSEIQKFYAGKTVLLTGSTGFMGKTLVEKLLRGCPDLKCIYVMIRPKKGLSSEERMKKYFTDVLFETLRDKDPNFASKVIALEGDLEKEDLGLSEENKKIIIETTNIIFHNASNVKFTERISKAARVNVLGTAMTTDLAMKCKNIEGFMYVSTAFSHCYQPFIEEKAYPPPADLNTIKDLITRDESSPKGLSETEVKSILGKYPNTYIYTKASAEGLVSNLAKRAPFACSIYRPAIVISSWKEPLRGWVDNLNGPAMLFVGYGLGIIHAGYMLHNIIDFIPVDMAINSVIVSMWDTIKNRPKNSDVFVYNYGSSNEKPISVERFRTLCLADRENIAWSVHMMWHHFLISTKCVYYFVLCHILFHFIPAIFVDAYLLATGKKPMALSAFKKVTLSYSVLSYFFTKEWRIDITETTKAVDRMNPVDYDLFFCDVRKLDWADYAITYVNGLRVYLLNDPMSTKAAGTLKQRRLERAHYTIVFLILSYILYFIVTRLGLL